MKQGDGVNNKTVLAIGAHPDDIEIGCGGTIKKHVLKGDNVYYLIATNGEKGGDPHIRMDEARRAATLMGVNDIEFLELKDAFILHDGATVALIDDAIRKYCPSIVYVHSLKDYHQDHHNIARAVLSASRKMQNSIMCYEAPSTTLEFIPTAFSNVTDTFEMKIKCINEFHSQEEKDYVEREAVVNLCKFRGKTINAEYAEAFEVVRLLEW
ncbi:PIG-L deacetylase family protein [uncultured Methanolobus sp.]|uniref:PIG-L deacetylase family protein n=1 Tax=uncultured Methanolobus sp. TaxID=218300 RepID=UPI00374A7829